MKLDEKQQLVAELHDKFARSKIVIVTDYKGLDVAGMTELRSKLREVGVEYKVVKNTLLTLASRETDAEKIQDSFKGTTAVALSYSDPVAPAKVLTEFAKKNEKLEIRLGVMGGKVMSLDQIKALSSLPSREVLLAQVLSAMNGVATSFVRVLNAVPQSLLYALVAVKDKKAQQEGA